jgi:hypothetical protein
MCRTITATATVTYKVDDLLSDLEQDYPEEKFTEQDAIDMIHQWIKDDFGNTLADVRIEESNG